MVVIIMISSIELALRIVIAIIVVFLNVVSCIFILIGFICVIVISYGECLVFVHDNIIWRIEDSPPSFLTQRTIWISFINIHLSQLNFFLLLLLSIDMILAYVP